MRYHPAISAFCPAFPHLSTVPPALLTVSELNRQVRLQLEKAFPLLWVSGEISNLVRAASGHVYFSLKDSSAQVRCVMFRSRAQLLPWQLANGQQVEVQALVTLYEGRGDFQLNVEGLRRAGMGRLYEMFLKLREKLAAEGLFAAERKREIPLYPRRVGIVTSPQAAALRDVIAAFARRAPHVELIVYPTLVQGAEAPAAIVAALQAAYARIAADHIDVLLLVRGGGSLEDLWAFNDEAVARTLAVAPAPTLAGIGHETDTTIADYVADRRAATPTAAAELASAGWFDAAAELAGLASSLRQSMQRQLETRMQAMDRLALRLIHPAQQLAARRQRAELLAHRLAHAARQLLAVQQERLGALRLRLSKVRPDPRPARQQLDRLDHRLRQAWQGQIARHQDRLTACRGALSALSPQATLERGYSIARDAAGHIVRDARQLDPGSALQVRFARGAARATVESIDTKPDL